ncbi:hypothetical protein [Xenorhabdus miraniensis]|uniref:Pyrroloquinoline-quinone synthase n=1 Tax=Xenorhabdus miraniensis TaxID=351674 RepID=A0A2D0JMV7_9GAMM|nr:hypothetical protein [Xenorhabdus miraniensis]PHM47639.1 Pyrroloquinoline-quinone synthase [Xenorhabdus miraniensis]
MTNQMGRILTPDSLPKCLPQATLMVKGHEAILSVPSNDYTFSGKSAEMIQGVFSFLNGTNTVDIISQKTCLASEDIISLLDYLCGESVLIDINNENKGSLTGYQLVELVKQEVVFWRQHINNQIFWEKVHNGTCSKRQILGWGIEFYHYVDAANEYMAAGVAYCRESIGVRQKIAAHYAEEAGHGEIFLQGLMKDGLPATLVKKSLPLPSTRALINYLNEVAMESSLVYTAVFSLMQSDGKSFSKTGLNEYYSQLIELYPFAQGMFGSFLKHALIDARLDHQVSIFENLYANDEIISHREVKRTFVTIRQLVNYFILYYEYLFECYGKENSQLPRRAPQLIDFLLSENKE